MGCCDRCEKDVRKCRQNDVLHWATQLLNQPHTFPASNNESGEDLHPWMASHWGWKLDSDAYCVGAMGACTHRPPLFSLMTVILMFATTLLNASACCCSKIHTLPRSTWEKRACQSAATSAPTSDMCLWQTCCEWAVLVGIRSYLYSDGGPVEYGPQREGETREVEVKLVAPLLIPAFEALQVSGSPTL